MVYMPEFEDALVSLPAVIALDALVPGGIEAIDDDVYDHLRADRLGAALEAAESWYEANGPADMEAVLAHGLLLHETETRDEAIEVVDRGLEHHPGSASLRLAKAEMRMEQGNDGAARDLLDAFVDSDDDPESADPGPWRFAGDLYLDLAAEDEAVDCYERAMRYGTDDYETVIRLAQLHRDRENWRRSAECFERAADIGGSVVGPWREAAACWREAGRLRRALEAREHVLEARETDADDWAQQGIGYREAGEIGEAIEALEKATRLDPHRPAYWIELAHLQLEAGRIEESIRGYRNVLSHDETFVEALDGLAAAALEQGDLELAEETARESLDLDEDNPIAWTRLGAARLQRNDVEAAIEAFETATELDPDVADAWEGLADAHFDVGDREAGLEALRRAVSASSAGADMAIPYAEALLRAREIDELMEWTEPEAEAPDSAEWRLLRPVYRAIANGLDSQGIEHASLVEAFSQAVDRHEASLPMRRDVEMPRRMALVLDDDDRWLVEHMLDVLEGVGELERLETPQGRD